MNCRLQKKRGYQRCTRLPRAGFWQLYGEMAESSGVGIEVDLKKMAIRQETVEICEYFHLNPYQLTSAGSVLIFAEDGEKLVEKFQKEGRQAVVLGRTTVDTARVILGGEEKRYLDRPAPDELLKMYESK